MTTDSQGVRQDSSAPTSSSQTDFAKLTKSELVERLKYAEYMMIHMRDWYKAVSLKSEPYPLARDYERGFAAAMDAALRYLTQSPDWFRKKVENAAHRS